MTAQLLINHVFGKFGHSGHTGVHIRRQYTLGQIIDFLESFTTTDHQVTFHIQLLQCFFGWIPVPPTTAFGTTALNVSRANRAVGTNTL